MPDLTLVNLVGWSLQAGVLVAAAALAAKLLPIDSAAVRYGWWRAVLVVALALPVLQAWRPTSTDVAKRPAAAVTTVAPAATDITTPSARAGTRPFRALVRAWQPAAALALVLGALVRLAWLSVGMLQLGRLRRAGRAASLADIDADLTSCVPDATEIRYVDAIGQPVTFGIRRPVVVLPDALRAQSAAVQRAVIAHELWHVRRRDWGWLVAEEILRGVLWFHPGIWWLISRVQASREEVVDELTVLLTSSRRGYLEALLAFSDKPPLFAAAPFARRRHLYHRMLLLSGEAVMSSRRIVASCAGMVFVLGAAGWYGVSAFPLEATPAARAAQAPPRDPRPTDVRPASSRELELKKTLTASPVNAAAFLEVSKLQEQRGALAEAESTLVALHDAQPTSPTAYHALAALYNRTGQFDRTIESLERAAALDPGNPNGYQILATYYYEKVFKDPSLPAAEKGAYIRDGIGAADRALAIQADFVEALVYKNLLLRAQANIEPDAGRRQALVAEANELRTRALELQKKNGPPPPPPPAQGAQARAGMPPPPPPPPPPAGDGDVQSVNGQAPVRVGNMIKAPMKLVDVKPVYPPDARAAGVQGVVIIEIVIDREGAVSGARVLRSIPQLDEAAVEAVRQWRFNPTLLNGAAVPVIMTVTVNFSLQQ